MVKQISPIEYIHMKYPNLWPFMVAVAFAETITALTVLITGYPMR